MCTAVAHIGVGKTRQINTRFAPMASHYFLTYTFATQPLAMKRVRLKRMFGMRVTGYGKLHHDLQLLMH
jgi:hypothetical protein